MALMFSDNHLDVPHPRPSEHYCWINLATTQGASFVAAGYKPVVGDHAIAVLGGKALYEAARDERGYIRCNELSLFYISQQRYDEHIFELARINAERRQLTQQRFLEMCDAMGPGVKAIAAATIEEMQDRQKFDTRTDRPFSSMAGVDVPKQVTQAANADELVAAAAADSKKARPENSIFNAKVAFPDKKAASAKE